VFDTEDVLYEEAIIVLWAGREVDDLARCPAIHHALSVGSEYVPLPNRVVKGKDEDDSRLIVGADALIDADRGIALAMNVIPVIAV